VRKEAKNIVREATQQYGRDRLEDWKFESLAFLEFLVVDIKPLGGSCLDHVGNRGENTGHHNLPKTRESSPTCGQTKTKSYSAATSERQHTCNKRGDPEQTEIGTK